MRAFAIALLAACLTLGMALAALWWAIWSLL